MYVPFLECVKPCIFFHQKKKQKRKKYTTCRHIHVYEVVSCIPILAYDAEGVYNYMHSHKSHVLRKIALWVFYRKGTVHVSVNTPIPPYMDVHYCIVPSITTSEIIVCYVSYTVEYVYIFNIK